MKINALSGSIKVYVCGLLRRCQDENKTDEIGFNPKEQKFGCTETNALYGTHLYCKLGNFSVR